MMINICTILAAEERATVAFDTDDRQLYDADALEPVGVVEGVQFDGIAAAVEACEKLWCYEGWGLDWIPYRIKPEYFDLWGADADNCRTTLMELTSLARSWETTAEALLEQVEEA